MKSIEIKNLDHVPGARLKNGDMFSFQCHQGLSCFNKCCHNLNLFLYPYDIIRLKNRLGISSDQFLDTYVDIVLRPDNFFPEVLLRMADNDERSCPFLNKNGCTVYPDRPDTCRTFPVEQGMIYNTEIQNKKLICFFRPPDFCLGQHEETLWSTASWARDQDAVFYNRMTAQWAAIKHLFQSNPWEVQGTEGQGGKMAFMAAFNVNRFREFVFNSSFLKRYKVKAGILKKIKTDDVELMKFGFSWIKLFAWDIKTESIRL